MAVNANASTIREINLKDKDYFMASDNVYSLAKEKGWWDGKETFRFAYAYAPQTRTMMACRRREWRVFDLVAPSLHLDPNAENYPFSVKPDTLVTLEKMMSIFHDYYEGTPYDMRKTLTVTDKDGKTHNRISFMVNNFEFAFGGRKKEEGGASAEAPADPGPSAPASNGEFTEFADSDDDLPF